MQTAQWPRKPDPGSATSNSLTAMERKEFIKQGCSLCVGGLFLSAFLQSCATTYYATAVLQGSVLQVKKSEFTEVKKDVAKQRPFVLVRHEKMRFPIALYKTEGGYSALLMECTHNSCELSPHGDYLICPCHGSEFNKNGQVQNPPAENDLRTFKVTHDNESIFIHLA
jgi:cytochrome b6-f complex iron-sulfur subunit